MEQEARPATPLNPAPVVKEGNASEFPMSVLTETDMEVDVIESVDAALVNDVSDALHDLATDGEPAVVPVDDDVAVEMDDGEDDEDADMDDDDDDDSDYDFEKDLEEFDEEDDNDEVDEDERYHYFKSLEEEIEDSAKEDDKRDMYVKNMLAKRHLLTGEEAEWVDKFIKEQEEWKIANKKSVDECNLSERLAKFIPKNVKPKRPVRSTRK